MTYWANEAFPEAIRSILLLAHLFPARDGTDYLGEMK